MSHEDETTGPFDEADEHDYGDPHHQPDDQDGNGWNHQDEKQENLETEKPDAQKRNLYISNLSFETNEEILRERFAPFGEIVSIEIVRDPATKQSRGFGFITFSLNEEGENAVNTLNGSEINGRPLRVEHARRRVGHAKTPGRYLGPKGGGTRFPDRYERRGGGGGHGGGGGDRRPPYDDYRNGSGAGGRRSNSRERRHEPVYRSGGRSRSRERAPYDRPWGGSSGGSRYDSGPDSRGPPPSDRWGGPPGRRSRSRERGAPPPRTSYGGYDSRRDRR